MGAGAHGYFQVYKSMAQYTKARFLQDPAKQTPVFVRFSVVIGARGSADTARDPRGFAVKFYTEEGNYDLVGNNVPVFFNPRRHQVPGHGAFLQTGARHQHPHQLVSQQPFLGFRLADS